MIDLLSFPRSGSNWVAYIIENAFGIGVIGNAPDFEVKTKTMWHNAKVLKSHGMEYEPGREAEGLIFVLRNYKDNVPKYLQSTNFSDISPSKPPPIKNCISFIEPRVKNMPAPDYLCLLRYYHNCSTKKLLINYRELIANPEREIVRIGVFLSQFFPVDKEMKRKFIEEISNHTASSVGMYRRKDHPNYSGGHLKIEVNSLLKKKMEYEVRNRCSVVDKEIYEEYLMRYEEK